MLVPVANYPGLGDSKCAALLSGEEHISFLLEGGSPWQFSLMTSRTPQGLYSNPNSENLVEACRTSYTANEFEPFIPISHVLVNDLTTHVFKYLIKHSTSLMVNTGMN